MFKQIQYLTEITYLKIFTSDQCIKIINTALNTWNEEESRILSTLNDVSTREEQNFTEDLDYRNTTLYIPPNPDEKQYKELKDTLLDPILGNIVSFNEDKDGYGFDIGGMIEPPTMMRYMAPDVNPNGKPGKYNWHIDIGPGTPASMRKLSYSILLNAGEYEGGELAFHTDRNTDPFPGQNDTEAVGSMILFPSYLVHRVLPVTKGIRYVIAGWVHGNSFA